MAAAAKSAIEEVREEGRTVLPNRVAQRFTEEGASGELREGDDLFEALLPDLHAGGISRIRIVVGRAGIGKSVLFSSLFARLYDDFLESKRHKVVRPRPIPFIPQHLRDAVVPRLRFIIESCLRSDVAIPVEQATFRWLLTQGFSTWLVDGLDEVYAGDPDFFTELADLMTAAGSRAQITLFCRDSLLSTSDSFQEFRELCAGSDLLTIYRLAEWDRRAKRAFAWCQLEGRAPQVGEPDSPPVAHFLRDVESVPVLDSLSGLPFYCKLLFEEFRDGHLREHTDEVSLLEFVVDRMIRREVDKGLLDLDLLEEHGLEDWLEAIAISYIEEGRYSELDRDEAEEYGRLVVRGDVDPEAQRQLLLGLLRFPLFRDTTVRARLAFTHDLIAEALAARGYLRALARDAVAVGHRLARVDLEEPTLLRLMSRRLDRDHQRALITALKGGGLRDRAYPVLLSLLMLARPERDVLHEADLTFEGRDVAGVRFEHRNLAGMSFRGADLSRATFVGCDLRDALFEGAFVRYSRFGPDNRLQGARFGDAERVESIHDGKRLRETPERVRDWIAGATGRRDDPWEPCPTALQLRHLFGKFITPLGQARRDDLRRDGLLAGKRYPQAAATESCLEEAVRRGYLVGPDRRGRFRRSAGDLYSEMVGLVQDSRMSDGLGQLITELCARRGCDHRLVRAT